MKPGTANWIEFAHRDLEAAQRLLAFDHLANIVLFHCQQCVEKSLKAVLEENKIQIPKIHSVLRLYGIIGEHGLAGILLDEEMLNVIDDIYIDTRYPGGLGLLPSGFPSKEVATDVYNKTRMLHKAILHALK